MNGGGPWWVLGWLAGCTALACALGWAGTRYEARRDARHAQRVAAAERDAVWAGLYHDPDEWEWP